MEFHETLQASVYLWGKYVHAKIKGMGPVPFELLPFIVLDGFCIDRYNIIVYII